MSKVLQQVLPQRSSAKLPDILSKEGQQQVQKNGWPFFRAGISLTSCSRDIMLVKQARERHIKDGREVWVPTMDGKWNLPYGPVLPWESLWQAADRHGGDQTAHDFDLGDICHIGFQFDADDPHVTVIYHADQPYSLYADQPNPEKVTCVRWFDPREIEQLAANDLLSEPELVLAVVQAERDHIVIPEKIVMQYQSRYVCDAPL